MPAKSPIFRVKLASTPQELQAAQRLRYEVFVEELGATGPMVDHDARLEVDRFDAYFDHLLLLDDAQGGAVVGVYRLLRDDQARRAGQYYSEDEYDLSVLRTSGRRLMELGRSCLAKPYRGGPGMFHLWNSLAAYVFDHKVEILFGVASFHGTDPGRLAQPLSLLHHRYLAPPESRVRARREHFQTMNLIPADALDRRAAMLEIPALIKAYLRMGGHVGEGAYIDHQFNTTDVCLVMDTERLNDQKKSIYSKGLTR
ncbi:hypothetical protein ROG8370_00551 [Roseovarius gaetbuli]|uniref:L-ornithine N(alpha)-acyltransferase n=1 Tax=Roseovarius gaetbuli TaxID=1356575 RepID=A0A1X6YE62_9RHOB|nr:GNAT family N-acyltransferase [Roseovarius gaetbuli]SLN17874.1 hypothetical protein ROG8370_00551 [Roseovarius gaetbuli]